MKKSVNGKSFDEIFEERGQECKYKLLTAGDSYLWGCTSGTLILLTINDISGKVLTTSIDIADDSSIDYGWRWMGAHLVVNKFFTATKNQIQLLNAYKNDQK